MPRLAENHMQYGPSPETEKQVQIMKKTQNQTKQQNRARGGLETLRRFRPLMKGSALKYFGSMFSVAVTVAVSFLVIGRFMRRWRTGA